jgi:pimeloyl-ACP methyl ester carboxylesterase
MTGLTHDVEMMRSFDGTYLAARSMGSGGGLPILIVDAIGSKLSVWSRVLRPLAESHPIYNWDLRGLFDSGLPANDRVDAVSQARDALEVLEHFEIDKALVTTWSSGGRIALQFAHDHPERTAGLALVCSGYGRSLSRLLRLDPLALLPRMAGVAKFAGGLLQVPFRRFVARPEIAGFIRQSGMVAAPADTPALIELLRGLAECDPYMLLKTYEVLSGDPAEGLLSKVDAPSLLVAGEMDQFTPRDMTDLMHSRMLGARLLTYEGATHFLPIEYPDRLTKDLALFLDEVRATS